MTITIHDELIQGSDEWLSARCGLLTASEMNMIVTPTLKVASNDKERSHLYELLAQRITKYVEPHYVSDDMLRGQVDEFKARDLYNERYAPVKTVGFITNDKWGFTIGYSPDGLVGDDGLIECKSRRQKFQVETLLSGEMPTNFLMQVQTGLLVSERKWLDFMSYSGGLPTRPMRILPDPVVQAAIVEAAQGFEARMAAKLKEWPNAIRGAVPTERTIEQEIF